MSNKFLYGQNNYAMERSYLESLTNDATSLSKIGNAHLRQMFWMAVTIAISMRENTLRKKFSNYTKEAHTNANLKRKAYTAAISNIERVAYIMIRHGTNYCCTHKETVINQ